MPIDTSTVGFTTKPYELSYDWKTLATYALGVGAKRDELPFLYEGTEGGMKVLPTFGVVAPQTAPPVHDPHCTRPPQPSAMKPQPFAGQSAIVFGVH